ncbi:MAG: formate dehydrogenase accessory sulfurtransferase FdhD [Saprospiraceae bacterium]
MTGKKIILSKWKPGIKESREDFVAIEEPLQINLNSNPVSITMRTPGDDKALAIGFFCTEGIIENMAVIEGVHQLDENTVNIILQKDSNISLNHLQRNFYTTSSCGVCGKTSVDAIYNKSPFIIKDFVLEVSPQTLIHLHDKLWNVQEAFQVTGGIHAAVLFNPSGDYIYHSEDVGRHNALDKLIGRSLLGEKLPLKNHILLLSGRASFELLQKSAMAGISFICSVGAPSSLAIELADTLGITLVGFLKKTGFNIYTHEHRIISGSA